MCTPGYSVRGVLFSGRFFWRKSPGPYNGTGANGTELAFRTRDEGICRVISEPSPSRRAQQWLAVDDGPAVNNDVLPVYAHVLYRTPRLYIYIYIRYYACVAFMFTILWCVCAVKLRQHSAGDEESCLPPSGFGTREAYTIARAVFLRDTVAFFRNIGPTGGAQQSTVYGAHRTRLPYETFRPYFFFFLFVTR